MVFYFSGTGNSQLVAKQITEALADELLSINKLIRSGKRDAFHSKQPFVFVAPTYAWRLPRVVERWIEASTFTGNQSAYFILTCGGDCGNAAAYAEKLCRRKNLRFRGLAPIVMPENYIALFPTPSEPECRTILEKAGPKTAALAARIQKGEPFAGPAVTFRDKVLSGPVNRMFYPLIVHDRGFTVSDACVSCGKCARRCPLGNIEMTGGVPVWRGNCTHCMACIGGCPTQAIAYKTKSKGRRRYFIMED